MQRMAFLKIRSFFVICSNQHVGHNIPHRSISSQFSSVALFQPFKRKVLKENKCGHLCQRSKQLGNKQFITFTRLYSSESGIEDTGSKEYIDKLVKKSKCVVFMKGIPEQPMCGFSNAVVQILRMHDVDYDAHNVLDDEALRAGIKIFSDWPTIPQIYINGEFIGGCDILLQLHQSGDLIDELKKVGIRSALLDEEADPNTK